MDQNLWSRARWGYSIYEMDGRFLSTAGARSMNACSSSDSSSITPAEAGWIPKTDFRPASMEVVNYLVAHRLAVELGGEEEIWFLEYSHLQLAIWRKSDTAAAEEDD